MSIERVFHCDWRECERHVQTASSRPATFITVTEGAGRSLHFCGWDCVLKHAAEKPPAEVVPMGEPQPARSQTGALYAPAFTTMAFLPAYSEHAAPRSTSSFVTVFFAAPVMRTVARMLNRIEQLLEQGYSQAEAQGRAAAEQAGYTPLPAHGVDKPGTIGLDRPGPKRAA